jgi:hypothetical protein
MGALGSIQRHVAEQFEGDRERMRRTLERLTRTLPLGDMASKQVLVKLIREKGASTETAHPKAMSKHKGLLAAWQVKAVW